MNQQQVTGESSQELMQMPSVKNQSWMQNPSPLLRRQTKPVFKITTYIVNNVSGRIQWRNETAYVKKNLFVWFQLILLSVKFFYILLQKGRRHALLYRHKCRMRNFGKEKQLKFSTKKCFKRLRHVHCYIFGNKVTMKRKEKRQENSFLFVPIKCKCMLFPCEHHHI